MPKQLRTLEMSGQSGKNARRAKAVITIALAVCLLCGCRPSSPLPEETPPPDKLKPEVTYDLADWTLDELSAQVYADIARIGNTTIMDVPWQTGYAGDNKLILFNGRYILSYLFESGLGGKLDCVDLIGNFDALSMDSADSVLFNFSPQGNSVALKTVRQEDDELIPARFLYDFDTKELSFLYDDAHAEDELAAAWSPGGDIYAVLYGDDGGLQVYHKEEKKLYTAAFAVESGEEPPHVFLADNGDICVQSTLDDGTVKNQLLRKETGYAGQELPVSGQVVWFGGQEMLVLQFTRLERYDMSGNLLDTNEYGLTYVGRSANMALFERGRSLVTLHDVSGEIASYEGVLDRPLAMVEKSGQALLYREGDAWELVNTAGDVMRAHFPNAGAFYLCEEPMPINEDCLVRVVMAASSHNLGQFYIEKITRDQQGITAAFDPLMLTKERVLQNNRLDAQYQAIETEWIPGEYASLSKQGVDVDYLYWNQQYTGVMRYLKTPGRDDSTYWSVVEEREDEDFDPFAPQTAPDYVLLSLRGHEMMLRVDGAVDDLKVVDIDGDGLEEWLLATSTGGVFIAPTRLKVIPVTTSIQEAVAASVSPDGTFVTVEGLGTQLRFHASGGHDFRKEPPVIRPGEYVLSDNGIFQRFLVCYGTAASSAAPLVEPSASASPEEETTELGYSPTLVEAGSFLVRYRAEADGLAMKVLQKEK